MEGVVFLFSNGLLLPSWPSDRWRWTAYPLRPGQPASVPGQMPTAAHTVERFAQKSADKTRDYYDDAVGVPKPYVILHPKY